MKITNKTLIKAIRTFIQAFFGSIITIGTGVMWYDVEIDKAIIGVFMTSIFAGLSAVTMNMEEENGIKKNSRISKKTIRK